jgi:hypothetical protein
MQKWMIKLKMWSLFIIGKRNWLTYHKYSQPMRWRDSQDKNWSQHVICLYWTPPQPVTFWRKSNKKMKQLLCRSWSWSAWSEQRGLIGDCQLAGRSIRNQSSSGLIMCSGACDDASSFTWTRGPLKTKDQLGRTTIQMMGPTCSIRRVWS